MRTIQQNIDEWLRREAHVVTGLPFQMDDCSCVPVAPQKKEDSPFGFFVTHGSDISFVPAETPEGAHILSEWHKIHVTEALERDKALPGEYWYG